MPGATWPGQAWAALRPRRPAPSLSANVTDFARKNRPPIAGQSHSGPPSSTSARVRVSAMQRRNATAPPTTIYKLALRLGQMARLTYPAPATQLPIVPLAKLKVVGCRMYESSQLARVIRPPECVHDAAPSDFCALSLREFSGVAPRRVGRRGARAHQGPHSSRAKGLILALQKPLFAPANRGLGRAGRHWRAAADRPRPAGPSPRAKGTWSHVSNARAHPISRQSGPALVLPANALRKCFSSCPSKQAYSVSMSLFLLHPSAALVNL